MATIRGLLVKISADTAELKTGMQEASTAVQEASEKITTSINEIKETFEGLLAATAFEQLVEESAKASDAMAQLQSAINATGATTGITVGQVSQLTDSLSELNGVSETSITSMEAVFATFNRISSQVLPQASQAALDLAARMGVSLPQAARQLAVVLSNPIAGMGRLKRVVGDLTEAQKDQIKQFLAVNDTVDAQGVVLNVLEGHLGGAAEAARDTLGGAMRACQADIENLTEAIGGGDGGGLRYALEAADKIMRDLKDHAGALTAVLNGVGAAGATIVAIRLAAWVGNVTSAMFAAKAATGAWAGGLGLLVGGLVALASTNSELGANLRAEWSALLDVGRQIFGSLIDMVVATVKVTGELGKAFDGTQTGNYRQAAEALGRVPADIATDWSAKFFKPMDDWFKGLDNQIKTTQTNLKGIQPAQTVNGTDLLKKGKDKSAQIAAKAAREQAEAEERIKNALQQQSTFATQINSSLKDQLQSEIAKTQGEESSVGLNRQIEQIQREAAEKVREIEKATKNGTLAQKDGAAAIKQVNATAAQLVQNATKYSALIQQQKAIQLQHKAVLDAIDKSTGTLAQKALAVVAAYKQGAINAKEERAELEKLNEEQEKQMAQAQEQVKKMSADLKDQIKDVQSKISGQEKLLPLLKMEDQIHKMIGIDQGAAIKDLRTQWDLLQKANEQLEEQKNKIKQILKQHDSQKAKQQQLIVLLQQYGYTYDQAVEKAKELTAEQQKQIQLGGQFSQIIDMTFQLAVKGAKGFGKELDNLLVKMAEMIAKALILATLTEIFSFGTAGAGATGFMASLSSSFGKFFGFKFAAGGRPPMGQPSLVGENGPELFMPDSAGTIIPNGALSNATGGGSSASQAMQVQVVQKIPANIKAQMGIVDGQQALQIMIEQAVTKATQNGGPLWNQLIQMGINPMTVAR